MIVIYLPQVISGKGHQLMTLQSLLRKDTNMKKLFSMLLVVLILVTSLSVTASAATNAGWDYEQFELYKSTTTARSSVHKAKTAVLQVDNNALSTHSVSAAIEMKTGNTYVQYGTFHVPVGLNAGTNYIDSPTGSAVDTRAVMWSSSGGVRATGDLGFYN